MALVKCPECGKEKVSDTAEACPECGYGIKAHFERIRREEHVNKILEEKRKAEEEQRRKHEEWKKAEEIKRLEYEKMLQEHPEMAKVIKEKEIENARKKLEEEQAQKDALVQRLKKEKNSEIKGKILCAIWAVFWTIACIWSFSASEHGSLGLLIVIAFFCAAGGWAMLVMTNGSVEQMESDIQTASRSVEEYQKVLDARLAYWQMQSEKIKTEEALMHPKCPNCGSTNTQRISTLNRAVSIGTVGLASSKIGKQYECKKCKHKW